MNREAHRAINQPSVLHCCRYISIRAIHYICTARWRRTGSIKPSISIAISSARASRQPICLACCILYLIANCIFHNCTVF
eukprot:XP_001708673.1 Hypothetical protein GL50803_34838 [Giardia lamblia ATCC 50803]